MVRVMWVALVTHALSQFRSRRTVLLFKMQERAEMRDFSFFFFSFLVVDSLASIIRKKLRYGLTNIYLIQFAVVIITITYKSR